MIDKCINVLMFISGLLASWVVKKFPKNSPKKQILFAIANERKIVWFPKHKDRRKAQKREWARKKREELKQHLIQYEAEKRKEMERWLKRRSEGKVKCVADMSAVEKKISGRDGGKVQGSAGSRKP